MSTQRSQVWVCRTGQLLEGAYRRIEVLYAGEQSSVIVFRFDGKCLAYRNLCVHMPRGLDCEKDMIFDSTGCHLRCSMHGVLYDPFTGESISTLCAGERLTPVKVRESEDGIWIADKRVKPMPVGVS